MPININNHIFLGFHNPWDTVTGKAQDPNFSLRRLAVFMKRPDTTSADRKLIAENLARRIEVGFNPRIFDLFPQKINIWALSQASKIGSYPMGMDDQFKPKIRSILEHSTADELAIMSKARCEYILNFAAENELTPKLSLMEMVTGLGFTRIATKAFTNLNSRGLTLNDCQIILGVLLNSNIPNVVILRSLAGVTGLDPAIVAKCIFKSTRTLVIEDLRIAARSVSRHTGLEQQILDQIGTLSAPLKTKLEELL